MTTSHDHRDEGLWDRMRAAVGMPAGRAQKEELLAVAVRAEAIGDVRLLHEARRFQIDAIVDASTSPDDERELVTTFVRWLALHQRMPDRFTEREVDQLWRAFAIVGMVLTDFAVRPAAQIAATLDDMTERCRPFSGDLSLITVLRIRLATRTGDLDGALEGVRRLRTLEPSRTANPATLQLETVQCLVDLEQDEEAVSALAPVLAGVLPFDDGSDPLPPWDPYRQEDHLLMPYLRTGRLAEAAAAHQRTHQERHEGFRLAQHLEFCARSGNEERGRELLHRSLNEVRNSPMCWLQLRVWAAAALLCRRLAELGYDEPWLWPPDPDDPDDDEEEEWTYASLGAELAEEAMEFVARMDADNGNTHMSERVRSLLDAEPVVERLPL